MYAAEERAPSAAVEDYAKAIYSLTNTGDEGASTNDVAARLGVSAGSVSAMLRKLSDSGLVEHVPYHGVRLSDDGQRVALGVLRRHRLLELFLSEELGMPWERVHEEAEVLEHGASEELIELIARKLGDPSVDPHGDPIPTRDLHDRRGRHRLPSPRWLPATAHASSASPVPTGDAPLPRRARHRDRRSGRDDRAPAIRRAVLGALRLSDSRAGPDARPRPGWSVCFASPFSSGGWFRRLVTAPRQCSPPRVWGGGCLFSRR